MSRVVVNIVMTEISVTMFAPDNQVITRPERRNADVVMRMTEIMPLSIHKLCQSFDFFESIV